MIPERYVDLWSQLGGAGWSLWLRRYLRNKLWRPGPGRVRVWLAIADHFEPFWRRADDNLRRERVDLWRRQWPPIAERCRDSADRPARYTFYYPAEAYAANLIEPLAEMTNSQIADVEVHLHHGGESAGQFEDIISGFVDTLHLSHGLFRRHEGKVAFGFIHGNWALDNSRPDGNFCGLNNEITLLGRLGCYADFTMPAWERAAQAREVNVIYWAKDDPDKPKSYDRGVLLRPGEPPAGELLMIPGPYGPRATDYWLEKCSDKNLFQRYSELLKEVRPESGELAHNDRPSPHRVRRWLDYAPRIGNDIFIKLFGHGAQERNSDILLRGGALEKLFRYAKDECRLRDWDIYFVSTWEMFKAVDALRRKLDPVAAALGTGPKQ